MGPHPQSSGPTLTTSGIRLASAGKRSRCRLVSGSLSTIRAEGRVVLSAATNSRWSNVPSENSPEPGHGAGRIGAAGPAPGRVEGVERQGRAGACSARPNPSDGWCPGRLRSRRPLQPGAAGQVDQMAEVACRVAHPRADRALTRVALSRCPTGNDVTAGLLHASPRQDASPPSRAIVGTMDPSASRQQPKGAREFGLAGTVGPGITSNPSRPWRRPRTER